MSPRLPAAADFSSSACALVTIVPPQQPNQQPANVLLLLHGLGDDAQAFAGLARSMSLPHTCCVAVRGPAPLPFDLGGFHWGDDVQFDPSRPDGGMDMDAGFEQALRLVRNDILERTLRQKCGFEYRNVLLLGLGQGGMAALACAACLADASQELGGVISIGGPLPQTSPVSTTKPRQKLKTPVLVCHGSSQSAIGTKEAGAVRQTFGDVQFVEWKRPGDAMMRNRDEMLPVMRFFARRLQVPAPSGTVQISPRA